MYAVVFLSIFHKGQHVSMCFFVAGMVSKLSVYGIQLKSRALDRIPGALIKTSMVRLMVDSAKALVFITPEYLD